MDINKLAIHNFMNGSNALNQAKHQLEMMKTWKSSTSSNDVYVESTYYVARKSLVNSSCIDRKMWTLVNFIPHNFY